MQLLESHSDCDPVSGSKNNTTTVTELVVVVVVYWVHPVGCVLLKGQATWFHTGLNGQTLGVAWAGGKSGEA